MRPTSLAARRDTPVEHVYVHMPFCVRRCPYCDFNAHAGRDDVIDAYIEALAKDVRAWAPHARATTIFVGGGTPTHGTRAQLDAMLAALAPLAQAGGLVEWTIEANPGSLTLDKVRALVDAGVNRVSLGAQTFVDRHLERLGRAHDARAIPRSVEMLRRGGMPRLSIDLMLALPHQTLGEQQSDCRRAVDLSPDHISAYILTYEPGTAFTQLLEQERLPARDIDREARHLDTAIEQFEAAGLARYEVSNFASSGNESQHNLAYWHNTDWIGIGAGAHGHVAGARWRVVNDPAAYVRAVDGAGELIAFREEVAPTSRAFESLMMGLRLIGGVDLARIVNETGVDVDVLWDSAFAMHVAQGHLVREGTQLKATPAGMRILNRMLLDFVPDS